MDEQTQRTTGANVPSLRAWYYDLASQKKRQYRQKIINECGISVKTFYRFLDNVPPKLVKERMLQIINQPL